MKKILLLLLVAVNYCCCVAQAPALKAVVYDFDGLNLGDTDLPDGDYHNNDLSYHVVATPLVSSDVLSDRAVELDLNWSTGSGEFGKNIGRFIDLNTARDYLNFYFYDPLSNGPDSLLIVEISEDDNSNNVHDYAVDDTWLDTVIIHRSAQWQLISLPLSGFRDKDAAGNGIFDAGYAGTGSMLFNVGFVFERTSAAPGEQYFMDMICFSEGVLPTGATILDLPPRNVTDHCLLGALANNDFPATTPDTVAAVMSLDKLKYVNWFVDYSSDATTPDYFTGTEVTSLLNRGITPVITWEMMYAQYPRLDPVQPRLDKILDGSFDTYIDAFADKIRSYEGNVILRILHEFDGNWYPWSLTENYGDPATFIAAWRHIVDRFRARGTSNVQWMWCVNAEPKPYVDYNWMVDSYPGDAYVDIVATDIYNHPDLGVPFWKSFRYTVAESYGYLTSHFPDKPFFICEVASRERYAGEPLTSQSKAEWICSMARDLKSYFKKTKALIFFSMQKEHDWRINSSPATIDAMRNCIWDDEFFGAAATGTTGGEGISFAAFPNPFDSEIQLVLQSYPLSDAEYEILMYDLSGRKILSEKGIGLRATIHTGFELAAGVYIIELRSAGLSQRIKVVKVKEE